MSSVYSPEFDSFLQQDQLKLTAEKLTTGKSITDNGRVSFLPSGVSIIDRTTEVGNLKLDK